MHILLPTPWKSKDGPRIVPVGSGIRKRPRFRLLVEAEGTSSEMTTNSRPARNPPIPTGSAASAA
ncbi:hypothetical protein B0T10DRAFT_493070 [Thelonectria olida]|uniref:Uncharacterized protein n=1 Tax=Thelonectria olida TaxID=1576542 RepID=A0A9P9AJ46_9HYPO|nr:hypothetical protein B0T10DRAFT_493070 [Thelonectria olida]